MVLPGTKGGDSLLPTDDGCCGRSQGACAAYRDGWERVALSQCGSRGWEEKVAALSGLTRADGKRTMGSGTQVHRWSKALETASGPAKDKLAQKIVRQDR